MTQCIVTICLLVFLALSSFGALAGAGNLQLGSSCSTDPNKSADCDVGLQCKNGYCAMQSFLSGGVVACKAEMAKAGVPSSQLVAVHDGFCYIESKCPGLYDAVMAAAPAAVDLFLAEALGGLEAFSAQQAREPDDEKEKFKRAVDMCKFCSPYCVITGGFH